MQTFLPYRDFVESAKCLDMKRLGKQRVEAWQLYLSLTNPDYGWKQHPASKMWKGYELALLNYGFCICREWIHRGYKDTVRDKILKECTRLMQDVVTFEDPPWMGNEEFHRSHQSNLVRKLPEHYRKYFPDVPNDLPYIWPVK